jgi:hypothetical protein
VWKQWAPKPDLSTDFGQFAVETVENLGSTWG